MRPEVRSRLVYYSVNSSLTVVVLGAAAGFSALGVTKLAWPGAWLFVALGVLAGAAIGSIRDSRILQAALGVTGAILLAFALGWARGGATVPTASVGPLLEAATLAFATMLALTRIWGRHLAVPERTAEDVDAVLAGPGMGVMDQ